MENFATEPDILRMYGNIIKTKGYGSKLLSFIKEYSKEIGCSEMFLITDKGNPRACHVYEKLGGKNDYKDERIIEDLPEHELHEGKKEDCYLIIRTLIDDDFPLMLKWLTDERVLEFL
ncbi:hypothetical protein EfmAA94_31870 (plasmid) [Enterococcus faecium]|nr:hypothetical protein EfmAA94_31870 [Enterococcus faecium]